MGRRFAVSVVVALVALGFGVNSGFAGVEKIRGPWQAKLDTPSGPMDVTLDFLQEGNHLFGIATIYRATVPVAKVEFSEPDLLVEFKLGDSNLRLKGTFRDSGLAGTFEQIGGSVTGPWTAVRKDAAPPDPSAGKILGLWTSVSVTQGGDSTLDLNLKSEGNQITGTLGLDLDQFPLQVVSFKDNQLQFYVDLGGILYRIEGTLADNRFSGIWTPVGRGSGGAWRATRKEPESTAKTEPPGPASLDGIWNSVAVTADERLPMQLELKQAAEKVAGKVLSQAGATILQKGTFVDGKVTFEFEYADGGFRVQATLEPNGRLTGTWASLKGTETGVWMAVRTARR